jgi:N-terminal domain of reverse transcriptase
MGKLDTVEVNGPEGEAFDWGAVDWRQAEDGVRRLQQRIFTASKAGDLKLLTPVVPAGFARAAKVPYLGS